MTEGTHILYVWANDSANNVQVNSYLFIIDDTPPNFSISTPGNQYYSTSPQISLNVVDTYSLNNVFYQINSNGQYLSLKILKMLLVEYIMDNLRLIQHSLPV